MRNTDFASIDLTDLVAVTGGCKRKSRPCSCPQPSTDSGGSVSVDVSTGGPPPAQAGGAQAPQFI